MQKQNHAPALPRRKELAKAARLAAIKRAAESINQRSGAHSSEHESINHSHQGNNDPGVANSGNDYSRAAYSGNSYSNKGYSNNDDSSVESSRLAAEAQPPGPSRRRLKEASAGVTERRAAAQRAGAS